MLGLSNKMTPATRRDAARHMGDQQPFPGKIVDCSKHKRRETTIRPKSLCDLLKNRLHSKPTSLVRRITIRARSDTRRILIRVFVSDVSYDAEQTKPSAA